MLRMSLHRLSTAVRTANVLVKTAAAKNDAISVEAGRRIMQLAKEAALELPAINKLLRKALSGLAVSAGAAIPAAALGAYLTDRAGEQATAEAQKTRDFIENAALGLAGAGLGLYAMHNMDEPVGYDQKTAAYHLSAQDELVEKLASIGVIDAQLDQWEPADEAGRKIAAELRQINDSYLVRILGEVVGD